MPVLYGKKVKAAVKKSVKILSSFRSQTKAYSPYRFDVVLSRGFTQLSAEIADVRFQGIFGAVGGVLGYALEKHGFCHDLPAVLHKQL